MSGVNGSSWGPGLNGKYRCSIIPLLTVRVANRNDSRASSVCVSVSQYRFYVVSFPGDKLVVKIAFLVFFLDTINTLAFLCLYYRVLIEYRWNTTYPPTTQMTRSIAFASNSCVAFLVQCFYAHRVWIIGGRNELLTCGVILAAFAQLDAYDSNDIATYFSNPDLAANALASAICDAVITASVFFCLRRSQNGSGLLQENSIQKLSLIFVQMGLITFDQAGQYFTAAPVSLLSKTYTNSMLAVLNARKRIRDRQQLEQASPSELPTLPTRH
ncbi:hypothetical protein EDD15DRAFT_462940 [Pisolithus albus]|nr:hypothetical protein EDD15DRAFT_462940 [Pisolithus albus]